MPGHAPPVWTCQVCKGGFQEEDQPHVCYTPPRDAPVGRFTEPRTPDPAERGELIGTITIGIHLPPPGDPRPHVLHYKDEAAKEGYHLAPSTTAAILAQAAMIQTLKCQEIEAIAAEFMLACQDAGLDLEEAIALIQNSKKE